MGERRHVGLRVLAVVVGALVAASVVPAGCGGRSSLRVTGDPPAEEPASDAFCAEGSFRGGFSRLSMYILLDQSESMENDGKWNKASAALSAFVQDPALEGLGVGLQLFPQGSSCDAADYALPAVPVTPLPDAVDAIQQVLILAGPTLKGGTPTRPVLRAGITHARALQQEDPSHAVIVAVVTDGAPNLCESSTESLVALARDGAESFPQVLTFVIGIDLGYTEPLDKLAAAGGTGAPVLIEGAATSQELVDALRSFQDALLSCRYPVPAVDATITAADVSAGYRLAEDAPVVTLDRVADAQACNGSAFYLEDPAEPTEVVLCPSLCQSLRENDAAVVTVTVGCGDGSSPSPPDPGDPGDPDACGGATSVACVATCGASQIDPPICVSGLWTCPAGTIDLGTCTSCPPVPSGCCQSDGSLAEASCIDGAWVCPAGAVSYGSEGCGPPEVCAATLLCPTGQLCVVPDFTCGESTTAGSCEPKPQGCDAVFEPVCGCNGLTYDNACLAASVGVDLAVTKACPTPTGSFDCGWRFCTSGTQICRRTLVPDAPPDFQCLPAPPGCGNGCAGCGGVCDGCGSCTESCTQTDAGEVTVTCTVL